MSGILDWKKQHIIAAIVSTIVFTPLTWFMMDREPPYERVSGEILPPDPKPGDYVEVSWQIKVNRQCRRDQRRNVTRTIIDSIGKITDFDAVEGVYGGGRFTEGDTLNRGFYLPQTIDPGPAIYKSTACFACNPIQYLWPICISHPHINFTIRPKQ